MTVHDLETMIDRGWAAPDLADAAEQLRAELQFRVTSCLEPALDEGIAEVARQFVPDRRELERHPAELSDPIGDGARSPLPGLVHRYRDRVLILAVQRCAVYCRFCFRKASVAKAPPVLSTSQRAAIVSYLREHPEVSEVIFSGGDPFLLPPGHLSAWLGELASLTTVAQIRFHTRIPVVEPTRIAPALLDHLATGQAAKIIMLHTNSPAEWTPAAQRATAQLRVAGCSLYSQSVLLRGVNATVHQLEELCRFLVQQHIRPVYLHYPDLVPGTRHFRVPLRQACALMESVAARLPGYARPRLMLDLPGGHGKIELRSETLQPTAKGFRFPSRIEPGHWVEVEDYAAAADPGAPW